MTSTLDRRRPHRSARPAHTRPIAVGVLTAVLASLLVNTALARAVTSTHHHGNQTGVSALQYGPLTVLGVLAGTVGWALIRRRARQPARVLRVVVPLVVLMSFVPDLLLLSGTATPANVAALLGMHIAIAAITVPVLRRVLPLPAATRPR